VTSIFNIAKIAGKAGRAGFALRFITRLSPKAQSSALPISRREDDRRSRRGRKYRDERTATTHLWRHGRWGWETAAEKM